MDSTQLKAIIVDDEPAAIRILKNFSAKSEQVEIIASFRNALKVQSYLLKNHVDVLFLDINMPELTGLELLESIHNPPLVILTTAYSEYAVESYNFSVVDYLLKPIAFSRFIKSIDKCKRLLLNQDKSSENDNRIILKDSGKTYHFEKNDLTYIQAYGNYLKLFTINQRIMIKSSLKAFLENYNQLKLVQIHKSYAVNPLYVRETSYSSINLLNDKIPIGRKYRSDFIKSMNYSD